MGGQAAKPTVASRPLVFCNVLASVCRGVRPLSSMSLRNFLRTTAECFISQLAGDLPHLEGLPAHHLKAEKLAAQRMQLGQRRLQRGGKGSGGVPARVTPRDSAREEQRHLLLLAGHRQGQMQRHRGQSKRVARSLQCEISSTAAFFLFDRWYSEVFLQKCLWTQGDINQSQRGAGLRR